MIGSGAPEADLRGAAAVASPLASHGGGHQGWDVSRVLLLQPTTWWVVWGALWAAALLGLLLGRPSRLR